MRRIGSACLTVIPGLPLVARQRRPVVGALSGLRVKVGCQSMSIDSLSAHFLRQELFQGLRPLALTEIVRRAERVVYRPGQIIISDGEEGDAAVLGLSVALSLATVASVHRVARTRWGLPTARGRARLRARAARALLVGARAHVRARDAARALGVALHGAARGGLEPTPIVDILGTGIRSFYVRDPDGLPVEFLQGI